MVNKLMLTFTLLITVVDFVTSENVVCNFTNNVEYYSAGKQYRCLVSNNLTIETQDQADIKSISGTHVDGKRNRDGLFFHIYNQPIKFFPRGMAKVFSKITGIILSTTEISEIHQEDLKPYFLLEHLYLHTNNIEVIEDGLFDFNPEVNTVVFSNSKIFHIGSSVFDNLVHLFTLQLYQNKCISKYSYQDRERTLSVIEAAQSTCQNFEFMKFDQNIKALENCSATLHTENFPYFSQNLTNLQAEFESSSFTKFTSFKQKLQKLKNHKLEDYLGKPKPNCDYCTIFNHINENKAQNNVKEDLVDQSSTSVADLLAKVSQIDQKIVQIEASIEQKLAALEKRLLDKIDQILITLITN